MPARHAGRHTGRRAEETFLPSRVPVTSGQQRVLAGHCGRVCYSWLQCPGSCRRAFHSSVLKITSCTNLISPLGSCSFLPTPTTSLPAFYRGQVSPNSLALALARTEGALVPTDPDCSPASLLRSRHEARPSVLAIRYVVNEFLLKSTPRWISVLFLNLVKIFIGKFILVYYTTHTFHLIFLSFPSRSYLF